MNELKQCGSDDAMMILLEDFLNEGGDGVFKVIINYKGTYKNYPRGDYYRVKKAKKEKACKKQ